MFKAIQKNSQEEIIALDPTWDDQVEHLRRLDRADLLMCQGCKQTVRLKAGTVRIRHFAHKTLGNCTYGNESPALLMARALLYQRLHATFGEAVTVEKLFDDKRFPRPVDCWVERDGAEPLAYWIIDAQVRPKMREAICDGFAEVGAQVHWMFTAAEMLRNHEENENALLLSTTERELAVQTVFDAEIIEGEIWKGGSLHYLNAKEQAMVTFRGLHCIHSPQVFRGRRLSHPLSEMVIAPKTGEFAHPGERERLTALREERRAFEEARKQREEAEYALLLARIEPSSKLQSPLINSLRPSEFDASTGALHKLAQIGCPNLPCQPVVGRIKKEFAYTANSARASGGRIKWARVSATTAATKDFTNRFRSVE